VHRLMRHFGGKNARHPLRDVWLEPVDYEALIRAKVQTGEDRDQVIGKALQLYAHATTYGTEVVVLEWPYAPGRGAQCTVALGVAEPEDAEATT
jgi:hypothetical protein